MSTNAPTGSQFEFAAEHNKRFQRAGYWMGIMGRLGILFGALSFLPAVIAAVFAGDFTSHIQGVIGGVVAIVCGIWTISAAAAFRRVDESSGRDVDHVMEAVENLGKLFRLQAILIGIAAALFIGLVMIPALIMTVASRT